MRKATTGMENIWRRLTLGAALGVLCVGLAAGGVSAGGEAGQYLYPEDLRRLEPAYDAFLQQLADVIIQRGLISAEEREDWLMYQLGDYYQNGGAGMIAAMFSPGLLAQVRPQDSLLRLQKPLSTGTLHLDTMRAYSPLDGSMPGLMLEASFTDVQGLPARSRFRWTCVQGGFSTWDALGGRVVDVGVDYINDGRPAYWSDQPVAAGATGVWRIYVDVLAPDDDAKVLGSAELVLTPSGSGWVLDSSSLL